jgi:hypothetical protein
MQSTEASLGNIEAWDKPPEAVNRLVLDCLGHPPPRGGVGAQRPLASRMPLCRMIVRICILQGMNADGPAE